MKVLLVTGAAGFIGSNFVRRYIGKWGLIVGLDKLTYAGNLANLRDLPAGPFEFIHGDIADAGLTNDIFSRHAITDIVNFAAETHVDRSIAGSGPFVQSNIVGTQTLLDAAKEAGIRRFVQISTDEVYGSLPEDRPDLRFTEETPLQPNSPYSASKAAADCLCRAYFHTFGFPVIVTRCSNNFGPYQFPEKIIPLFVTNLLEGRKLPLYGDGLNIRDWIYVDDHCDAVSAVLSDGRPGEIYNIGGGKEITNRHITEMILKYVGRDWEEAVEYVKDRLGHDRRYAIDSSKIQRELGWRPRWNIDEALAATIEWYRKNEPWWRAVKTGEYRSSVPFNSPS